LADHSLIALVVASSWITIPMLDQNAIFDANDVAIIEESNRPCTMTKIPFTHNRPAHI